MRAIRSRNPLYDPHTPHIGTDSGSSPPAPLDTPDLTIRFRWPGEGPAGECDNFFLGIWHPAGRSV